jgi:glutamate N-acetyltransferase/amino-acid N-acetyltransferase
MPKISPFAPKTPPQIYDVKGVRIATTNSGIRYKNRPDLLVALCSQGTVVAGTLTRSKTRSAPVDWCRAQLEHGNGRVLIANAGNSNAFTGKAGVEEVAETSQAASKVFGCAANQVYIASTGVIGYPIPKGKIGGALPILREAIASGSQNNWEDAASAIMTTDTYLKASSRISVIGGTQVAITGIAKGSGMIAPDMATMLAFIFTDAAIPQSKLQEIVAEYADKTFNCITVDSDTSTSDTLLVFATGQAGNDCNDEAALSQFRADLFEVMRDLAMQIVMDGEGITKLVTIKITGAENDSAAKKIGLSIANSPLVKTAMAGSDPNWGRLVAAIGKSGEAADRDKLYIKLGPVVCAENGQLSQQYVEEEAKAYMEGAYIDVVIDVGIVSGTEGGTATIYTCDLTHEYISINADYRS